MGDRYEIDSKSVNLRNVEFDLNGFYASFTALIIWAHSLKGHFGSIFGWFSRKVKR